MAGMTVEGGTVDARHLREPLVDCVCDGLRLDRRRWRDQRLRLWRLLEADHRRTRGRARDVLLGADDACRPRRAVLSSDRLAGRPLGGAAGHDPWPFDLRSRHRLLRADPSLAVRHNFGWRTAYVGLGIAILVVAF